MIEHVFLYIHNESSTQPVHHIIFIINNEYIFLSIPTVSILTFNPILAFFTTLATVLGIRSSIHASSIATTHSKLAFIPTFSTVVLIAKNISAMFLAAIENAGPFVCRNPIANVLDWVTMCTFFDDAGQEPAS